MFQKIIPLFTPPFLPKFRSNFSLKNIFLPLYLSFSAEFSAVWQQCLDQSGWSMAMRGKGEWTNYKLPWEFSESYFTLEKHSRYREGISVQKSEDYKTLILILLGEITFVIGPDFIFVNLWGACDSAVLQCGTECTVELEDHLALSRAYCTELDTYRPRNKVIRAGRSLEPLSASMAASWVYCKS